MIKDEDRYKEPLTYKVARIEGFSLFCDWEGIDSFETGGFDMKRLAAEPDKYYKEILAREFSDHV